jgi:peptidoglycan hydrolase-like protein with peptidoglycan-binding domain
MGDNRSSWTTKSVKAVQEKLIGKGFDLGKNGADGLFRQVTVNAVLKFQDQKDLEPVDGIVVHKNRQTLGL